MSKRPHKSAAMRDEYDFTDAVRGKFYRKAAVHIPPVHLDPVVAKYLQKRADARGISLSELVNEFMKKHIEIIEVVS